MREENERLRRENEEHRQRQQQFEVQLAEIRGRVEAQTQRQPQDNGQDRLKAMRARANQVLSLVGEGKASMDEYYDAMDEYNDARAEARGGRQQPAMIAEQIGQEVERRALEAEFPWLPSNAQARRYADGEYDRMVAKGMPEGGATARAALAAAAAEFGLGGSKAPPVSDGQRRLYAGISSRATGGSGDGTVSVSLDDREKALAHAAFPSLSPKEAETKMAAFKRQKAKERGEI
jgi:hypothetical protein